MKILISMRKADPEKEPESKYVLLMDIGDQHLEFPGHEPVAALHSGLNHLHTIRPAVVELLKSEADVPVVVEKPAQKRK